MTGKADYQPSPGYGEKLHLVGPTSAPVWIGRKADVPYLFDDFFWTAYRSWERFHLGLAGPDPDSWLADAVLAIEGLYRSYFSHSARILQRLELLIELSGGKRVR